jgi:hypothetical protein
MGFYNRDEMCLLRGTEWVSKQSSLRFVFKGLMGLTESVPGTPLFSAYVPHIHRGETLNLYPDYLVVKDVQFQFVLRIGQPKRFLLRNGMIDFQRNRLCDI